MEHQMSFEPTSVAFGEMQGQGPSCCRVQGGPVLQECVWPVYWSLLSIACLPLPRSCISMSACVDALQV